MRGYLNWKEQPRLAVVRSAHVAMTELAASGAAAGHQSSRPKSVTEPVRHYQVGPGHTRHLPPRPPRVRSLEPPGRPGGMATVWSSEAITRSTTSLIGPVRRAGDRPADRLAAATYASAGTGFPHSPVRDRHVPAGPAPASGLRTHPRTHAIVRRRPAIAVSWRLQERADLAVNTGGLALYVTLSIDYV